MMRMDKVFADLERCILAGTDKHSRVRGPSHTIDCRDMSSQTRHEFPGPPLPDFHSVIKSRTCYPSPVRGEGHVVDLLLVTRETSEGFLRGCEGGEGGGSLVRPKKQCMVVGSGDEGFRMIGCMVFIPSEGEGSS